MGENVTNIEDVRRFLDDFHLKTKIFDIVFLENGDVKKIVEQKDATQNELKITTANAGIYQFCSKFLLENLPKLNNNNAQKEYYITDPIVTGKQIGRAHV